MINLNLTKEEYDLIMERRRTVQYENDYVVYDDYAEIILRTVKGKEKCRTKVSLHRIAELKDVNWFASGNSYVSGRVQGEEMTIHRFIMEAKENEMVDHINGDKFDNRDENLRICTRSENMMNTRKPRNNQSGFKGVSLDKRTGKWKAYITINKKQINLGTFVEFEDAVSARIEANKKYQGEFAYGKGVVR